MPIENQFIICGGSSEETSQSKRTYLIIQKDVDTCSVKRLADMVVGREEFGLVMGPDNKIYAIGGYNSEQQHCLASVERYDIEKDTWEIVTQLHAPMKAVGAAALPDGIYVIGGYEETKQTYSKEVYRYDPVNRSWHQAASMNYARGAFTASTLTTCDFIYAVGGFGVDGSPTEKVERYDVAHNKWESVAPMHSQRFMHSTCLSTIFGE